MLTRIIPKSVKLLILSFLVFIRRLKRYGFYYFRNNRGISQPVVLADNHNPTFFGYHDKTPFSLDGSKILAMSIAASDTDPKSECTPMRIGYFAKNNDGVFVNEFIPLSETTTWCFQQGCMLQWHPNYPDSQIVYNKLVDGKYGAAVFDLTKKCVIKEYETPIYALDPTGILAASLNFSRLNRLRPGYGYRLLSDETEGLNAPENDGVFIFNLKTKKQELLISLAELAEDNGNFNDEHYVNHISFSPSGERLVFFHVWLCQQKKRNIRFCQYDLLQKKYSVLESEKTVSHFCWADKEKIFASTKDTEGRMILTSYDLKNNYSNDVTGLPLGDTHPMRSPKNSNLFVLDSYPDKCRDQHLFLFDLHQNKTSKIASLYSPTKYRGQVRCDLHPRWDRDGKQIIVDSAAKGKRALFLFKI